MSGSADIARETQDLHVVVIPEINLGTASVVAMAVNPVVGVSTLLAQLFLRNPVMKSLSFEYKVTGPWSDPVVVKQGQVTPVDASAQGSAGQGAGWQWQPGRSRCARPRAAGATPPGQRDRPGQFGCLNRRRCAWHFCAILAASFSSYRIERQHDAGVQGGGDPDGLHPEVEENFASAARLVAQAAQQARNWCCCPNTGPSGPPRTRQAGPCRGRWQRPDPGLHGALARQHQIWLVGGTLPLQAADPDKVLNTTLVYDPQGQRVARYDKIHLFNFVRAGKLRRGPHHRTWQRGAQLRGAVRPGRPVGLLRPALPELYRAMGECA
jgi:hypothetical protein